MLRKLADDDRRVMMDVVGLAIAEALPENYRGVYGNTAPDLDEARRLLRNVRES